MVATVPAVTLSTLAEQIREEYEASNREANSAIVHALNVGKLLIQSKEYVEHGEWGKWLKDNCPFSERKAQIYMQLSQKEALLKSQTSADLAFGSISQALKALTPPKPVGPSSDSITLEDEGSTNPRRGGRVTCEPNLPDDRYFDSEPARDTEPQEPPEPHDRAPKVEVPVCIIIFDTISRRNEIVQSLPADLNVKAGLMRESIAKYAMENVK